MISFIVIGRNVENTILCCIDSIYKCADTIGLLNFEVLYVDSLSTDLTMTKLEKYISVRKFIIHKGYNAATARNIGAKEAKGESLFFLDADMELQPMFLTDVLAKNLTYKSDYLSGDLINYYYKHDNFSFINSAPYFGNKLNADQIESVVGGVFFISKHLYESIQGMNNYYNRCEDYDFGLRLARKGVRLTRLKETAVIHHTVSYIDFRRMKGMLLSGDFLYVGLLNREHILNPHFWYLFIRNSYSFITLVISLLLIPFVGFYSLILYLLLILVKANFQKVRVNHTIINFIIYFVLRDLQEFFGMTLFFPSKKRHFGYSLLEKSNLKNPTPSITNV